MNKRKVMKYIQKIHIIELIDIGHTWIDALAHRNITTHTYDEQLVIKLVEQIRSEFVPILHQLYERLKRKDSICLVYWKEINNV
nr:nucleotidyltransferase substrate binding protein [Gracilibacillus suaedae]